jgi:hypothetical protein
MGCSIIRVLNIDHIFVTSLWMLLIVTPQKLSQHLIYYFYLPIYMWKECCRSLQLGVHLFPKHNPKGTEKYGIPIYDDAPCYPKVHLDLFKEHACYFLSFDGLFTKHKNVHLVEHIHYQEEIVMSFLGCWKTTHKIHGNTFSRLSGYR